MNTQLTQPNSQIIYKDNFEKGHAFEVYITSLFKLDSFKIVDWRKARKIDDSHPFVDLQGPDLRMIFQGKEKYRFAVECKWRNDFHQGAIRWAKPHQIDNYKRFQYEYRVPVFIAIGIGGQPSQPQKLFVTPLYNIEHLTDVYESDLTPYKRKPTRRFFLDTRQRLLF